MCFLLLILYTIGRQLLYVDIDKIGIDKHLCSNLLEYSHLHSVQKMNLQWKPLHSARVDWEGDHDAGLEQRGQGTNCWSELNFLAS